MSAAFTPSVSPDHLDSGRPAWWFLYRGNKLLVKISGESASVPLIEAPEELGISAAHRLYIGTLGEIPCWAAEAPGGAAPDDFSFEEIRTLFARLEDGCYEAALTALHLVGWEANTRYCGRCAEALRPRTDMRAKECPACGRLEFPRISPAVIVLIERGDRLLLARSARFPGRFFSILAGFVEPGEGLEAAVRREVMEETGIGVKEIRYFGSQPWPFPDSLMIGFVAQYESGEIRVDGEEIVEAGWYRADSLPALPGKLSIARSLIDWFIEKHRPPR